MNSFSLQLMQIKADLRDVLYSHKWTPDAYLMAKAYVAGRDLEEEEEKGERLGQCCLIALPNVCTGCMQEM